MPSTVIASYHYNPDQQVLTITFVSGKVYHYLQVPESVYHQMKASFSKGIFFNQYIKDAYKCKKEEG